MLNIHLDKNHRTKTKEQPKDWGQELADNLNNNVKSKSDINPFMKRRRESGVVYSVAFWLAVFAGFWIFVIVINSGTPTYIREAGALYLASTLIVFYYDRLKD